MWAEIGQHFLRWLATFPTPWDLAASIGAITSGIIAWKTLKAQRSQIAPILSAAFRRAEQQIEFQVTITNRADYELEATEIRICTPLRARCAGIYIIVNEKGRGETVIGEFGRHCRIENTVCGPRYDSIPADPLAIYPGGSVATARVVIEKLIPGERLKCRICFTPHSVDDKAFWKTVRIVVPDWVGRIANQGSADIRQEFSGIS